MICPSFLRLSSEIRDRIYRLVGTYNQSFFSSGLSMQDPFDLCGPYGLCEPYRHTSPRIPPVGFYGLLLTCRTIYSETSALLYSSNQFFCHYEALHSLSPLRDLRAKSVASLTSLKIILNQASCHSRDAVGRGRGGCCTEPRLFEIYYGIRDLKCDQDCRYSGHSDGGERHDPPLRRSHPSTKPMLAEWYKTAAYLGRHITPGRLELSFVCDIHSRDTELAIMVLDAFRHFPPLKNCHIRLSKTPNSMLRNLARNAVLRCRSLQPSLSLPPLRRPVSPVSGLAGLPRELRLHILEYTDLVTPLKEVLWTVSPGKYVACQPSCPSWVGRGNHDWEPGIHHGCQFNHCSERPYWDTANYVGCYCQLTHAAASSTCRCWAPPTSLFLVSRAMRHDASSVFFSQNRFAVVDSPQLNMFGPSRQSGFDQTRRLAVSRFLRDVVPVDCLGYLRFVEMVFPPYIGGQWPLKGDAVYKEWAETIAQVKDKLNLPALTIRMVAAFHLDHLTSAGVAFLPLDAIESQLAARSASCSSAVILGQPPPPVPAGPGPACMASAPCSSAGDVPQRGPRWPNAECRSLVVAQLKRVRDRARNIRAPEASTPSVIRTYYQAPKTRSYPMAKADSWPPHCCRLTALSVSWDRQYRVIDLDSAMRSGLQKVESREYSACTSVCKKENPACQW
ncbi:predicted protein [Chaetomium globosum CBS 148.51]|uniref:F-box domain-containing protein n=1 Tax=Chaetomium globosum (strain ATCC 6205 / CBS 148.51 / DSM 1962 / NBRC 6347 / NRRL 1970) TaxID=306901 RepID=Q2HCI2_CHAGB|nr:uncharacterized protein CHGG_02072 [Chaetomium globosum CBS 148.51]EAQ93837.1 predicted protein [Chaetomium globosum CBS 148.51]